MLEINRPFYFAISSPCRQVKRFLIAFLPTRIPCRCWIECLIHIAFTILADDFCVVTILQKFIINVSFLHRLFTGQIPQSPKSTHAKKKQILLCKEYYDYTRVFYLSNECWGEGVVLSLHYYCCMLVPFWKVGSMLVIKRKLYTLRNIVCRKQIKPKGIFLLLAMWWSIYAEHFDIWRITITLDPTLLANHKAALLAGQLLSIYFITSGIFI